ncbi:MAG: recombinase family protein, partial [Clostridia bacterium]|nr:recombinase family protein [Clostridia bacterium]
MKYGYMRTSKTTQELALQRDALEKYGVSEIYEEQVSGVKNRPQLEKLLNKLQKGDTLVVWKLDRLGRTAKELVNLVDAFDKRGIHFVSLTENIDTVSPTGKFLVTILCAMAAMERDVLIMRTKAGLEAAKKRGRVGGRPKVPKDKVKEAITLYRSNEYSIAEICQKVQISRATLYRIITA